MGKQFSRTLRVRQLLKEEISQLIQREVKDARIQRVTVSDVEGSPDLKHATVYVQTVADDEQAADVLSGLRSAAGFIRSRLGRELRLRRIPELRFQIDKTHERAARISQLLQEVKNSDRTDEGARSD